LEISNYLGNGWEVSEGVLTEAPILGFNSIYEDDLLVGFEKTFYYPDYMIKSFANELLTNKKVIFKKA
jgi:hypothetical protein